MVKVSIRIEGPITVHVHLGEERPVAPVVQLVLKGVRPAPGDPREEAGLEPGDPEVAPRGEAGGDGEKWTPEQEAEIAREAGVDLQAAKLGNVREDKVRTLVQAAARVAKKAGKKVCPVCGKVISASATTCRTHRKRWLEMEEQEKRRRMADLVAAYDDEDVDEDGDGDGDEPAGLYEEDEEGEDLPDAAELLDDDEGEV